MRRQLLRWAGQCGSCEAWNTLVETVVRERAAPRRRRARQRAASGRCRSRRSPTGGRRGCPVGIGELDRVLGGGLVPGSIVLFGGDPGIGKSTLLLQAGRAARRGRPRRLYLTGEESASQVRGRAERVGAVVDGAGRAATGPRDRVGADRQAATPVRPAARGRLVQTDAASWAARPGASGRSARWPLRLAEVAKADGTASPWWAT